MNFTIYAYSFDLTVTVWIFTLRYSRYSSSRRNDLHAPNTNHKHYILHPRWYWLAKKEHPEDQYIYIHFALLDTLFDKWFMPSRLNKLEGVFPAFPRLRFIKCSVSTEE